MNVFNILCHSSAGRAPAWHAGGSGSNPLDSTQFSKNYQNGFFSKGKVENPSKESNMR